jgi:predicted  nucleic acid-binding Zn-ribbon protein
MKEKENVNKRPVGNDSEQKGKTNKSSNRKSRVVWIAISVIAIFAIVGTALFYSNYKLFVEKFNTLSFQSIYLQEDLNQRDSLINEYLQVFAQIEQDLRTMQDKEAYLKNEAYNPELTDDIKERVLTEIQQLNSLLAENQNKIIELNNKIKKSGITIAALNAEVENLANSIAQRDSNITALKIELVDRDFEIAELNMAVEGLNMDVVTLNMEVGAVKGKLAHKEAELNKAYYTTGEYKELEERGIVKKEGGFLGLLGRTKTIKTDFADDEFKEIDATEIDGLVLNGRDVKLLSDHPAGSYQIIHTDSLISFVEIKDPVEFWKISKYAVFETDY